MSTFALYISKLNVSCSRDKITFKRNKLTDIANVEEAYIAALVISSWLIWVWAGAIADVSSSKFSEAPFLKLSQNRPGK